VQGVRLTGLVTVIVGMLVGGAVKVASTEAGKEVGRAWVSVAGQTVL
jgi:hypothetical protein